MNAAYHPVSSVGRSPRTRSATPTPEPTSASPTSTTSSAPSHGSRFPTKRNRTSPGLRGIIPGSRGVTHEDFIEQVLGYKRPASMTRGTSPAAGEIANLLLSYHHWIGTQLTSGRCVNLYQLGTLSATYRACRENATFKRVTQPAMYVPKFKLNSELRKKMVTLAKNGRNLFRNRAACVTGSSPHPGRPQKTTHMIHKLAESYESKTHTP